MTTSTSRSSALLPVSNCCDESKPLEPSSAGDPWNLCIHPQGWIYFYNPSLRIVVDHDIRDLRIFGVMKAYLAKISELPESLEIHLHLPRRDFVNDTGTGVLNLVINHSLCIASHKAEDVSELNARLLDPMQLNRCRRLYWNYLWNHPAHVPLPPRAIEQASDALMWFHTDNLVSGVKSVVPFSKNECNELTSMLRDFTGSTFDRSVAKTVFVSWFLREVCSFRDAESWGQHTLKQSEDLRETRNRNRLGEMEALHQPSPVVLGLLNFVINFLFFGIPHTYRAHVKVCGQYHQRLSNIQQNWEKYIERLVRDYSHFLLISTMLLSATVGVLALPEIPSSAMTAAMISALGSLGSIIVGVFFIWRHQANSTTRDYITYMHNARWGLLGFHGHSLLLSLPAALLVWAVLAFSMSLILYVMKGVNHGGTPKISAWITFVVFVVLVSMVVLTLYTFSVIWKFRRQNSRLWDRLGKIWKKGLE